MLNRTLRVCLCLLAVLILPSLLSATTYYVDCNHGSNGNAGTSPSSAWQTLAPVNAKTFSPGDFILLFAGCEWTGVLSPGGSGSASGGVITIDQYGTGALPRIDGGGIAATVALTGQEYWDVNNLEITNGGSAGNRQGVLVNNNGAGVANHIHLVGLFIHDIAGELGSTVGDKSTGGIGFETTNGTGSFNDILIQNCTIGSTSDIINDVGIWMSAASGTAPRSSNWASTQWTDVVVQGNYVTNTGKNAIIVRSSNAPLIQYNVVNGSSTRTHGNAIFTIGTLNAAIQYNEVYNTSPNSGSYGGLEDSAFDPDNDSVDTLVQYNYSHNNPGGLANPNFIPGAGNYSDGTIIRYNISQGDGNENGGSSTGNIIQFSGACTNTQIYNNTIYIGSGYSPIIFGAHLFGGTGNWASNTTYSNNIIYSAGGGGQYSFGSSTGNVFDGNLYFGVAAPSGADPNVITGKDPLLVDAGSGGTGVSTLAGYYLQSSSSPAAASGVVISSNGGLDFFGNTLPGGAPDRGAVQGFPPDPDFTLSAGPSSQSVAPGAPAVYTVTTAALNGLSGAVALSATGQPAESSVTFNPATGPGSSTMTVTTSSTATPEGSWTITVTGTYANISHSTPVTLVVTTGPNPPTNLTATAASSSEIDLSWTASTTSGVTYSIFRSTTSGFTPSSGNQIASGLSGTTYSDTGLTASTTYYYLAEAVGSSGTSAASNQATATTLCSAPTTPSGLGATATSSSQINLSWTASTAGAGCSITYNVFRSTTSGFTAGSGNQIASGLSGTTFSDTGLTASTTYFYLVEGVDSAGSSAASNQATATTPAPTCAAAPTAPSGLGASAISSSQINLSWTASTAGTACSITYSVFRSTTSGFTAGSGNQIATGVTSTTYSDTGLTASTTYFYLVEGVDAVGSSAASNQANATTQSGGGGGSQLIAINSGGPAVSPFVADEDFTGGGTIDHANTINTSKVTNPAPAAVYQSGRDTTAVGPGTTFSYTIGGFTAGTSYLVRLHFCETFFAATGKRTFNVSINGTQVLTNFDIFATAGGENIANIQQFTEAANASGQFVILFTSEVNNALISGIEIDSITSCSAPTAPSGLTATATSSSQINLSWTASTASCAVTYDVFRSTTSGFTPSSSNEIASGVTATTFSDTGLAASTTYYYLVEGTNSGGTSAASNQANATTSASTGPCSSICINSGGPAVSPFVADEDFTGGATIDHANTINTSKVTNPAPAAVYQTGRDTTAVGPGTTFSYTIGGFTAGSSHTVRLHFCETFFTATGKRTFNVSINGTQVLTDFDIFATAGGENIANIQQFTENANASGQYVILFTSEVNNALISGIEID
jgi:Malectin domain